jgi:type II secretory pathway component GspD/PulD (secretin)
VRIITVPASLLLLWAAGVGVAASPETPQVPVMRMPSADEHQSMDLRDLITMAGSKFGKQFAVDPKVSGSVNLDTLSTSSLTYHGFLEVLGVHGFIAVPADDVVNIIPEAYVARVTSPVVKVDDIQGDDAEVVTVLIPIEGDPRQLAPILRMLIPQWASIETQSDQKAILVVDRVANIKRIVALVRTQSTAR